MGRTVAVTGVSGYIGKTLLSLLERSAEVDHIIGIDTVEIPIRTGKLEFHTFDVRDPWLADLVRDADTLVHLAFIVNPMRDEALMHDVNVGGFRNVLAAVEKASIRKLVYPSSVYAYGAHPDNEFPLTERSPLRPNFGFNYALHKAETEDVLSEWQSDHGDVVVSVLRPAITLGVHTDNFMSRALEPPFFVTMRGHAPPLQVLHEDDAAAALLHFVEQDHPGRYNICADAAVDRRELLALLGAREMVLYEDLMFPLTELAWKIGLTDTPAGELNYMLYPCVMANERARATGWMPKYGNVETITLTVHAHSDHVSFGPFRTTRAELGRRMRRTAAVGIGSAVVAAALGALAARRQ